MSRRVSVSDIEEESIQDFSYYDFDFSYCDTKYLTHGIHGYPARMPPQIPKTILNHYRRTQTISQHATVFDPFAGSGTTGVEAQLCGLSAILMDLNPLAALLSKVKTTPVSPGTLYEASTSLLAGKDDHFRTSLYEDFKYITDCYSDDQPIPVDEPEVSSRFKWFPKPQLYHLAVIRRRIDHLERRFDPKVIKVLRVTLSAVCRDVSYQRTSEYKRYRIPKEEWEKHNPDVLTLFRKELARNLEKLEEYESVVDKTSIVTVYQDDSRIATPVAENSADIVITSPPYGDHDTTVAYGQYSLDPAVISMDVSRDEMRNVDKQGLGGSDTSMGTLRKRSRTLDATISTLNSLNGRSEDALSFFTDYFQVLKQVSRVLKPGQPAVFVVANRQMSNTQVPTHEITKELLQDLGFENKSIVPRELPYKTLPYKNSPSNIPGETGEMMSNEHLVIARNGSKQ